MKKNAAVFRIGALLVVLFISVSIHASAQLHGRTLYTRQSLNYTNVLDLSDLPGGVYFITVSNKPGRAVFPVVKGN